MKTWWAATAVLAASLAVVPSARADTTATATVDHWSDGDTVVTDLGTIRLIGVNAPDKKACGYKPATKLAEALAPQGATLTLTLPDAHDDTDAYGRLLRYVAVGGVDIGLQQIKKGSQAKYDSTDGYDKHPRQKRYRQQDIKHRDYCANHDLRSYRPVSTNACPKKAPIKGNRSDEWIYHLPTGDPFYKVTNPEECFASEDGAKKAGLPRRPRISTDAGERLLSHDGGAERRLPVRTADRLVLEMHQGPAGEGGWPGPDRPRICWTAPGQRRPVKGREHWRPVPTAQRVLGRRVTPVEARIPCGKSAGLDH